VDLATDPIQGITNKQPLQLTILGEQQWANFVIDIGLRVATRQLSKALVLLTVSR